jgi:serine/threonine-protein kinase
VIRRWRLTPLVLVTALVGCACSRGELPALDAGAGVTATPAPPAPAEAAPAPVNAGGAETSPGLLNLDASPWANITLDGRSLGDTPLSNVRVSPGAHVIVGTNPENGKTVRRSITVVAGRTQALRLDMH